MRSSSSGSGTGAGCSCSAKADKLTRAEQAALKRCSPADALLFSSVTRQGVEECRGLLESWLEQAAEIKSPR